jgi:hypothetical protein
MKELVIIAVVAVGLLLVTATASVTYYFVFALPQQAQAKLDLEKQKFDAEREEQAQKQEALAKHESQRQQNIDDCLIVAGIKHDQERDRIGSFSAERWDDASLSVLENVGCLNAVNGAYEEAKVTLEKDKKACLDRYK